MSTGSSGPLLFRSSREVAIHVPDLDRAEAFYGGVLGFLLVAKTDSLLQFDTGELMLYVNKDMESSGGFIPSLGVADAAAARRIVEAAGCEIVREYPDSLGFYFRDPFGLVLDVIQLK
jgi:catechol 2,3-dioxygenase-like lactoylglutathione lyase family enzyme